MCLGGDARGQRRCPGWGQRFLGNPRASVLRTGHSPRSQEKQRAGSFVSVTFQWQRGAAWLGARAGSASLSQDCWALGRFRKKRKQSPSGGRRPHSALCGPPPPSPPSVPAARAAAGDSRLGSGCRRDPEFVSLLSLGTIQLFVCCTEGIALGRGEVGPQSSSSGCRGCEGASETEEIGALQRCWPQGADAWSPQSPRRLLALVQVFTGSRVTGSARPQTPRFLPGGRERTPEGAVLMR